MYPEHEKLKEVKDRSQEIGAFLEWLQSEKGWSLGQHHEHDEGCYDSEDIRVCGYGDGEFFPVSYRINGVLAEYFGIDENKLEQEKQQMLEEVRSANKEATP